MMIEIVVDGKTGFAFFSEKSGIAAARGLEEVHREFLLACGPELPGAQTAAEIGMNRAALEKAAVALQDQAAAWRMFEAQRYGGNAPKLDAVLRAHLGVGVSGECECPRRI